MTAFFLLFSKINQTYTYISNQYIRLIEMIPRVEKLSELYEKESRLVPGPLEPEQLEGRIELVDVSFTYPSRPGQQVLRWSGATSLVHTSPDTLLSLVQVLQVLSSHWLSLCHDNTQQGITKCSQLGAFCAFDC